MSPSEEDRQPAYRIGAVSRMTGIPTPTIRMWERRYGVVEPGRSPRGGRLYSKADVSRLALVRRAVESGHAVGSVARLPDDQIRARLQADFSATAADAGPCRVAILGPQLALRLRRGEAALKGVEIVAELRDRDAARKKLAPNPPDVLVVDQPTVHARDVPLLHALQQQTGARHLLVVYGFASAAVLERLARGPVHTLRAPLDAAQLQRACLACLKLPPLAARAHSALEQLLYQPLPQRQFDEQALARISTLDSVVKCECPRHLSDLLLSLGTFERYSAECESAGDRDAALHALLHATAAQARSLLEQALAHVLEFEQIKLPKG